LAIFYKTLLLKCWLLLEVRWPNNSNDVDISKALENRSLSLAEKKHVIQELQPLEAQLGELLELDKVSKLRSPIIRLTSRSQVNTL
jgi:hypothetical protein